MIPTLLFDLKTKTREVALGFMARHILQSRVSMGLDQDQEGFDEDVNIYLAHLLLSFANPAIVEEMRSKVSLYDLDLARQVDRDPDRVSAFFLYKGHADFFLFSLGILKHIEGIERLERFGLTQGQYSERARMYYQLASDYHQQIYRKATSLSEILEKLALWFPRYVGILNCLRSQYFSFARSAKAHGLEEFMEQLRAFEQELELRRLTDEFLDAYSAWLKDPAGSERHRLDQAVQALRRLKPDFPFSIPSLG